MYRIDLHTHSIVSQDGGLTSEQYKNLIKSEKLDYIAITDHNEISFAVELQKTLGDRIIVGEEILTTDGEVIGLYLTQRIAPGFSATETIQKIREQNGLVYVPHPFETMRKGLSREVLLSLLDQIDIIEKFNARGRFRNHNSETEHAAFASLSGSASSDAHCRFGIGTAYNVVSQIPTRDNLQRLLSAGTCERKNASILSYLCPTINRLRKRFV